MSGEERQKHANEISNKYVPGLLAGDEKIMQEIADLSIQDIITIYSNAIWATKNHIFPKSDMSAVEAAAKIVMKKIKEAKAIWTVTDRVTNAPFIDDSNSVWLFSEKEIADECVDHFRQQYRTTFEVTEIPGEEIEEFLGITAYARGAGSFVIDNGRHYLTVMADEIAERPDFSTFTSAKNPVVNPALFRAIAKFQQERLWRVNYKGKAEKLRALEDDMIKAFCEARLIIPVKITAKQGSTKATICIPSLSNGDGHKATPAFTDWKEMSSVYPSSKWSGWVWTINDLLAAPDDTIVVNCKTLGFVVTKEMLRKMKEINETEFQKTGTNKKGA